MEVSATACGSLAEVGPAHPGNGRPGRASRAVDVAGVQPRDANFLTDERAVL